MFNSKFGVGVLKHPGYNIGGGVGESLLLESVLTNAVIGGGISALTGGDFLTGALTGGIGGAAKSFMPSFGDLGKIFNPAGTAGTDIATSAVNAAPSAANAITSQAGQAFMGYPSALLSPGAGVAGNIPAGTFGFTADGLSRATDAAITTPVAAQNPLSSIGQTPETSQIPMTAGNPAVPATSKIPYDPTSPASVNQVGTQATQPVTDYAKIIQNNNIKPIGLAPPGVTEGVTKTGDYVFNGKIYSGKTLANSSIEPSFFQKYKTPLMLGGLGLGYKMLTAKPPTLGAIPQPNYPKFGLASNYQALPNPTPVYPGRGYAEGGIAALASGGNMAPDKVNVDFMHGDMYPMSQQNRSFYATPSQMPTGALQAMASYEPKTNPLTGQPTAHMADGGIARLAAGGRPNFQSIFEQLYAKDRNPMWGLFSTVPNENWNIESQTGSGAFGSLPANISSDYQASSVDPSTWNKQGYAKDTQTADMSSGGVSDLGAYSDGGRMLRGPGDGMSDSIPGMIANKRPARLAEGEFVVPADVVSHLGNGSTDAGAKQLYAMMNRVRKARTGTPKQGKQINPRKLMTA